MAPTPRGRSVFQDDDHNRSYESSPDPLNASLTSHRPLTPLLKEMRASRTPRASASPVKGRSPQNIAAQLARFVSPSKSMVMNTGRQGSASPWRIKVTVQAEPEGTEEQNAASPTVTHVERRMTTKVPLKDDSATPVKRRGRPRKSSVAASASSKRSGTPVKRRGTPIKPSEQKPAGLEEDIGADLLPNEAAPSPAKRKVGRPKKQKGKVGRPRKVTIKEPSPEQDADSRSVSGEHVDEPSVRTAAATPQRRAQLGGRRGKRTLLEYEESAILDTPPETELRKRLKSRKGTPHSKAIVSPTEMSEDENDVGAPFQINEEGHDAATDDTELMDDTMALEARLDHLQKGTGDDIDEDAAYTFDEGTTRMPDDTTVIDSEHFSMISVDSLPCKVPATAANLAGTPASAMDPPPHEPASSGSKKRRLPLHSDGEERFITPAVNLRSPSQPPPLEQPRVSPSTLEPHQREPAVKAAAVLQEAVDPEHVTTPRVLKKRKISLEDIFSGFSDGTRKELQSRLRLGQRMAGSGDVTSGLQPSDAGNHQPSNGGPPLEFPGEARRLSQPTPENEVNEQEQQNEYPDEIDVANASSVAQQQVSQLLSPALSEDEMDWQADPTSLVAETDGPKDMVTAAVVEGQEIRAARIYLEGEDVEGEPLVTAVGEGGHKIQGSEIYVVAGEGEDLEYSDIWQEEASRSSVDETTEKQRSNKTAVRGHVGSRLASQNRLGHDNPRKTSEAITTQPAVTERLTASPSSGPKAPVPNSTTATKKAALAPDPVNQQEESDEDGDTGLFFHSEKTNVYQRRTRRHKIPAGVNDDMEIDIDDIFTVNAEGETGHSLQARPAVRSANDAPKAAPQNTHRRFDISESLGDLGNIPTSPSPVKSPPSLSSHTGIRNSSAQSKPQSRSYPSPKDSMEGHRKQPGTARPNPFRATPPSIRLIESSPLKSSPLRNVHSSPEFDPDNTATSEPSDIRQIHREMSTQPGLPMHPVTARFSPLPRVEPWTKSHYKTLNALHKLYRRQPSLFTPRPADPSDFNSLLLSAFLETASKPFVGAHYQCWGYSASMTEKLVVVAAVFMQLLTLESAEEYERTTGNIFERGDVGPREDGLLIDHEEVMKRLATVVMGERLRADEKKGVVVDKSGEMKVRFRQ
ncbi:hypothetical protein M011DRAFT_470736 [Sporormia fimetaria CBS 119925]|uniref:Uncharacterized protein n=1 Tax=Sporormia fimetaria CBS 119925 TaxID=1340428 RepID=A0A6A6V0K9_9PLEO|nr:hypothetical protein M011DRAFT_470736 [Sporormia fimetaria CBS 119925]